MSACCKSQHSPSLKGKRSGLLSHFSSLRSCTMLQMHLSAQTQGTETSLVLSWHAIWALIWHLLAQPLFASLCIIACGNADSNPFRAARLRPKACGVPRLCSGAVLRPKSTCAVHLSALVAICFRGRNWMKYSLQASAMEHCRGSYHSLLCHPSGQAQTKLVCGIIRWCCTQSHSSFSRLLRGPSMPLS